jgi:hypothetical protein
MNRILTQDNPNQFLGCLCIVKREITVGGQGNYIGFDIVIPLALSLSNRIYMDCIVWHRTHSDERIVPHLDSGFSIMSDELELVTSDSMIPTESIQPLVDIFNQITLNTPNRTTTYSKLTKLLKDYYASKR